MFSPAGRTSGPPYPASRVPGLCFASTRSRVFSRSRRACDVPCPDGPDPHPASSVSPDLFPGSQHTYKGCRKRPRRIRGGFPRDRLNPYFKWRRCFNPCWIHRRTSGRSPSHCLHDTWNGLPERGMSVPENRPERNDGRQHAGTCADRLIAGSLLLGLDVVSPETLSSKMPFLSVATLAKAG